MTMDPYLQHIVRSLGRRRAAILAIGGLDVPPVPVVQLTGWSAEDMLWVGMEKPVRRLVKDLEPWRLRSAGGCICYDGIVVEQGVLVYRLCELMLNEDAFARWITPYLSADPESTTNTPSELFNTRCELPIYRSTRHHNRSATRWADIGITGPGAATSFRNRYTVVVFGSGWPQRDFINSLGHDVNTAPLELTPGSFPNCVLGFLITARMRLMTGCSWCANAEELLAAAIKLHDTDELRRTIMDAMTADGERELVRLGLMSRAMTSMLTDWHDTDGPVGLVVSGVNSQARTIASTMANAIKCTTVPLCVVVRPDDGGGGGGDDDNRLVERWTMALGLCFGVGYTEMAAEIAANAASDRLVAPNGVVRHRAVVSVTDVVERGDAAEYRLSLDLFIVPRRSADDPLLNIGVDSYGDPGWLARPVCIPLGVEMSEFTVVANRAEVQTHQRAAKKVAAKRVKGTLSCWRR